ncbi:caspase family protein [Gloeobacter violaceus]|nr:caspase family protein [Gloeobacter violaceus]
MADIKALIVAINDYPGTTNDLPSCLEDARKFIEVLKSPSYGLRTQQLRTLYDAEATIKNVTDGLDWLLSGVSRSANGKQDARRILYFSGHGFRTELEGILRECLCLHDGFFFDQQLSAKTQGLPPGMLTVILDSCHSGGMEKPFLLVVSTDESEERTRNKVWIPEDLSKEIAVELDQTVSLPFKAFGGPVEPPLAASKSGAMRLMATSAIARQKADAPRVNGLVLSACRAEQTAAASTSRTNGMSAFTYGIVTALTKAGQSLPSYDRLSNARLLQAVAAELSNLNFKQTPEVKEPDTPQDLGSYTFITLQPMGSIPPPPPDAPATGSSNWLNSLWDMLRGTTGKSFTGEQAMVSSMSTWTIAKSQTDRNAVEEKFFGSVLRAAVRLAPMIANVVSQLNKDYQPDGTSQQQEKFLGALIGIGSGVIPYIPRIIRALRKDFEVDASPEADEKFLGAALRMALHLAPTVSQIIEGLRKDYQPDGSGTPEGEEKFIGAVLQTALTLSPTLSNLLERLRQDLRKDYEPAASEEDEQKFFGAVLRAGLRLAPAIAGIVQALGKDFQMGESEQADEKFFGSLLRVIRQVAPVVGEIVQELRKDYQIDKAVVDEEVEEKFFGSVLRAAVRLAPMIVNVVGQLNKDYQPDGASQQQEKFLGALIAAVTTIAPAIPDIIQAFRKDFEADGTAEKLLSEQVSNGHGRKLPIPVSRVSSHELPVGAGMS